ncbi:MAG: hypothetical protein AB1578_18065 [Thermodesulfobacteriota bacterium]
MADVLVCWLGNTDLKAAQGDPAAGLGPIGRAVAARPFGAVHLLSDYPKSRFAPYAAWLRTQTSAPIRVRAEPLSGPTRFGEIYEAAVPGTSGALEATAPGATPVSRRCTTDLQDGGWRMARRNGIPAGLASGQSHGVSGRREGT